MLAIYKRDNAGLLTREVIEEMSKQEFINYYNLNEITEIEKLVGWPESKVLWYDNIGLGE